MVKAKVSFLIGAVLLLAGCAPKPTSVGDHAGFTWQKFLMDGSRTGVTAVAGPDVKAALGSVEDGVYTAPNGRVFTEGSVVAAASGLLACQDTLAYLKEVVGQCPTGMVRAGCNSQMASWTADALALGVESITGKKVDLAVTNLGGIRMDMPKGDVLLDDISSMFPFKNYLCYVALRGSDVRALLEQFAATRFQALSGVKAVTEDGKLVSVEVGGKPLDDRKTYGVATIDFLLDGGDGISVARNARNLIITDVKVLDWVKTYLSGLAAEGKGIGCPDSVRVEFRGETATANPLGI